jgi:hypothetical protein
MRQEITSTSDFGGPPLYLTPATWARHCFRVCSGVPDASIIAQSTAPISYVS